MHVKRIIIIAINVNININIRLDWMMKMMKMMIRIDSHCSEVILILKSVSSTAEVLHSFLPQGSSLLPLPPLSPSIHLYLSSPCINIDIDIDIDIKRENE